MKTVVANVMRVGKVTTFCVGLAVILALTVGLASTALAGTGVGARFDLGKTNAVNAVSKLVGSVAGPSLTVDNNSNAVGATALDLRVEPGKRPFTVNPSAATVTNLSADELDGKDSSAFFPIKTYQVEDREQGSGGGSFVNLSARCDPEDATLSGGVKFLGADDAMLENAPDTPDDGWFGEVRDNGSPSSPAVVVLCADLPPLRP